MKKILLSIFLLFTLAYTDSLTPTISSDSEVGKWRSFFGVEGGVGAMSFCPALLASFNLSIIKFNQSTFDWSYGGSVLGGWQKYTSEKVGIRHTLGFRVFVDPNTDTVDDFDDKHKGKTTAELSLYYAFDGMFDFVKNGENRFGMILGVGTDVISFNFGANTGISWLLELTPRIGFYSRLGRHEIDVIASVPIIGMVALLNVALNNTITLGYKHFF